MKFKLKDIFLPKNSNLTSGNLGRKMLIFAIPIVLQAFLQILFVSGDMLILVYFGDGQNSVAAIGNSLNLINLIVNMFTGLSGAVVVLLASALKKKDKEECDRLVGVSMFIGLIIGVIGLIVCVSCAKFFLRAIRTPDAILDLAVSHFRCYFIAFPFIILSNFFISILLALGNSKSVFYNVLIRSVLQTGLSSIFVITCKLDVLGVGLASTISMIVQAAHGFWASFLSRQRYDKFKIKNIKFYKKEFISIFKMGVLIGATRFLISFANTSLQSEISLFGEVVLAGSSVAGVFISLVSNVMGAISSTCMVAVSQNFGANNCGNFKKIIKYSFLMIFGAFILVGVPILASSPFLISFFLAESVPISEDVITLAWEAGMIKLVLFVGFSFVFGIMQCLNSVLDAIKYPLVCVINTFFTSVVFRLIFGIILINASDVYNQTNFILLVSSMPVSWLLSSIVSAISIIIIARRN